eukprot:7714674-Pyramimonas_sp.AAC.1
MPLELLMITSAGESLLTAGLVERQDLRLEARRVPQRDGLAFQEQAGRASSSAFDQALPQPAI